jgi:rhodanese-related sulfurtransferase
VSDTRTVEQLRRAIESGAAPVVLDVRSRREFVNGRVPGARHMPFWQAWFRAIPRPRAGEPVVVYCGHGPRARMAAALLRLRGVRAALLTGHMARWRRERGPEERGEPVEPPSV